MNEKEYYRSKIVELIENLENERLLEYFYYFISLKIKAG